MEEAFHPFRRIFPAVWRAVFYQEVCMESAVVRVVRIGVDFVEPPAFEGFAVEATD